MKQFFTLFTAALCSVALCNAEVVLTKATHGLVPDNDVEKIRTSYQEPGEAGTGLIWDFSQAAQNETALRSSSSNIGPSYNEGNIKANRNEDGVSFLYNVTDRGNEYLGYETDSYSLIYSTPILKTVYPQSLGTKFEGTFEGQRTYKNYDKMFLISGTYSTHADATGTIILPTGESLEALRVHTTQIQKDGNRTIEIEKYLWYVNTERLPVFVTAQVSYVKNSGDKVIVSQSSYYTSQLKGGNGTTSIEEIDFNSSCKVFPNPFVNTIRATYYVPTKTTVNVDLYNMDGTKLANLLNEVQEGQVTISRDIAQYTSAQGTYFVKIMIGNDVYSHKIIKK